MFEKMRKMFKKESDDNENKEINDNANNAINDFMKEEHRDDIFIKKIIQLIRLDKIEVKLEDKSNINSGKVSILIDEDRELFLNIKYNRTYAELCTQYYESIVNCLSQDSCCIEIVDKDNILYKKYDTKYNRYFVNAIREKFFNVRDIEDIIINM